jgi:hypothetical protein
MFVNVSELNEQSLYRTFHRCFLPSSGSFGQTVSEEKFFYHKIIRFYTFLTYLVSFCHHLASVVCGPLIFHILIFSSETPQPNEVKLALRAPDVTLGFYIPKEQTM